MKSLIVIALALSIFTPAFGSTQSVSGQGLSIPGGCDSLDESFNFTGAIVADKMMTAITLIVSGPYSYTKVLTLETQGQLKSGAQLTGFSGSGDANLTILTLDNETLTGKLKYHAMGGYHCPVAISLNIAN